MPNMLLIIEIYFYGYKIIFPQNELPPPYHTGQHGWEMVIAAKYIHNILFYGVYA